MKHVRIEEAWRERGKLIGAGDKTIVKANKIRAKGDKRYAKNNKFYAEAYKLYNESVRLYAEGDDVYRKAVMAMYGRKAIGGINWETGEIGVGK